jgi:HEPN domain-containing protein
MNPLTHEWIEKAEGDYNSAEREFRARRLPNYNDVCFHTQQMAEKYLKAVLQETGLEIPRTHNLIDLMVLCAQRDDAFMELNANLKSLNDYAVIFRYPGENASHEDASEAIKKARVVRKHLRNKLGGCIAHLK